MNIHVARPGSWSSADISVLSEKWSACSARQLMEFLPGKSRSSIIAKARRLGLAIKGKGGSFAREPRDRKAEYQNAKRIAQEAIWLPLDSAPPVTLLDRKRSQCAWPLDLPHEIGSPFVCGSPVHPKHVYCASHCNAAYQPRKKASGHFSLQNLGARA